jgi:hypothetical protein
VQALTVGFFGVLSAYIAPVLFLALFPIAACLSFIAGKSITRRFVYTVNYRIGYIVGKRAGRRHAKTGKEIPGEAAVKSLAAESRLNVARIANRILFAYFGVAIGITMLGAPPWLPGEHISLKNTHAVIGYVLGRQDGDVAVLVASPRKVIHLNAADITRRILCTPHAGSLAATLPSLLGQSTQYPPC